MFARLFGKRLEGSFLCTLVIHESSVDEARKIFAEDEVVEVDEEARAECSAGQAVFVVDIKKARMRRFRRSLAVRCHIIGLILHDTDDFEEVMRLS